MSKRYFYPQRRDSGREMELERKSSNRIDKLRQTLNHQYEEAIMTTEKYSGNAEKYYEYKREMRRSIAEKMKPMETTLLSRYSKRSNQNKPYYIANDYEEKASEPKTVRSPYDGQSFLLSTRVSLRAALGRDKEEVVSQKYKEERSKQIRNTRKNAEKKQRRQKRETIKVYDELFNPHESIDTLEREVEENNKHNKRNRIQPIKLTNAEAKNVFDNDSDNEEIFQEYENNIHINPKANRKRNNRFDAIQNEPVNDNTKAKQKNHNVIMDDEQILNYKEQEIEKKRPQRRRKRAKSETPISKQVYYEDDKQEDSEKKKTKKQQNSKKEGTLQKNFHQIAPLEQKDRISNDNKEQVFQKIDPLSNLDEFTLGLNSSSSNESNNKSADKIEETQKTSPLNQEENSDNEDDYDKIIKQLIQKGKEIEQRTTQQLIEDQNKPQQKTNKEESQTQNQKIIPLPKDDLAIFDEEESSEEENTDDSTKEDIVIKKRTKETNQKETEAIKITQQIPLDNYEEEETEEEDEIQNDIKLIHKHEEKTPGDKPTFTHAYKPRKEFQIDTKTPAEIPQDILAFISEMKQTIKEEYPTMKEMRRQAEEAKKKEQEKQKKQIEIQKRKEADEKKRLEQERKKKEFEEKRQLRLKKQKELEEQKRKEKEQKSTKEIQQQLKEKKTSNNKKLVNSTKQEYRQHPKNEIKSQKTEKQNTFQPYQNVLTKEDRERMLEERRAQDQKLLEELLNFADDDSEYEQESTDSFIQREKDVVEHGSDYDQQSGDDNDNNYYSLPSSF